MTDVYGYEVNVNYDPNMLTYQGVSANDSGFGFTVGETSLGHIKFAYTKLGEVAGDKGNLTFVTIHFTAKKTGNAKIEFVDVKLVDSQMAAKSQRVGVKVLSMSK